ncbi:hypothetical protein Tco_0325195 [Tanacetum coccineum]
MFSIKLHHGGKFIALPKRMYVGGKVNYVDNIDVDLFNVDEVHMFLQDLGYDPKQLMFYHFKFPNKSLDYGLRPLSCDDDVVTLIKRESERKRESKHLCEVEKLICLRTSKSQV